MHVVQISGLLFIILSVLPAYAGVNKWVDEKGQTHYGDRVPAPYLGKDREVLNEQGVVVRQHKKLKSQEELSEEQRLKNIQIEENKKQQIEDRKNALRDRVLTDTFTTERDLLMARDRRIDAVASQINLTESIINDDEQKLLVIKQRIEQIEKTGREAPENTKKSLVGLSRQLEMHYQFVETKTRERENILRDFEKDIKRFRELRAAKHAR